MTYRLAMIDTATGQLLGTGENTYSTREEVEAHAKFYSEQVADQPYHYEVVAA